MLAHSSLRTGLKVGLMGWRSAPLSPLGPSVMVAAPKPLSVETANSRPLWFYLRSDPLLITQTQHVYTGVTKHPKRNSFSSYPTDSL